MNGDHLFALKKTKQQSTKLNPHKGDMFHPELVVRQVNAAKHTLSKQI